MGWSQRSKHVMNFARVLLVGLLLTGCAKELPQTPLDPRGPVAQMQFDLLRLSLWFAIGIGTIVSSLLIYVVFRFRARPNQKGVPAQIHGNTKLEVTWTIIPILILVIIGIPTVRAAFNVATPSEPVGLTVKATGNQWWFAFEYPDQKVTTANELYIPVGKAVSVELHSKDVIHSFWIPKLAGKVDMIPNRTNTIWFKATEEGTYYGQCAEFCGASHARMRFRVIAVSQEKFDAWIKDRQAGPKEPTSAQAAKGKEIFMKSACIGCHTIDGTAAKGVAAPNLSNVGGRTTIAAGVLENTEENLRRWIKNPTDVKPGAKMPSFASMSDDDLSAVIAYLQSLK